MSWPLKAGSIPERLFHHDFTLSSQSSDQTPVSSKVDFFPTARRNVSATQDVPLMPSSLKPSLVLVMVIKKSE